MKIFLNTIIIGFISILQLAAQDAEYALLELEYRIWQIDNASAKDSLLLEKMKIHNAQKQFEAAIDEYNRASMSGKLSTELSNCYALTSLLYGDNNEAVYITKQTLEYTETDTLAFLIYNLGLIETAQFDSINHNLLHLYPEDSVIINSLPVSFKRKTQEKAALLSAIFPGLGQFYCKKPLKGFTSTVIVCGTCFLTCYHISTGYYIAALVTGIYPTLRFWSGGQRLSYNLANEYNSKHISRIKNEYINYILDKLTSLTSENKKGGD